MTFYITTPIYYVNDTPHVGHAYTTTIADVLARYHRLFGEPAFMLTGTDEHGQKVQNAARQRGLEPKAHCDELVLRFKETWKTLEIAPDQFIRTTDEYHVRVVQSCLQRLWEKGEIYEASYDGWYCESEEIFYTEKDLVDGKSPHGKGVQRVSEKNYFFKMSKYQQRLVDYIGENPSFIQPEGKRSEVLGFLRQPLADLCISRPKSRLTWGIEIPFDADYVTYVWFDALLNYVSAIGYEQSPELHARYEQFWPECVHLIGKDILTTHAVYWPTMLMALELPLPRAIFAHGWWLTDSGSKMSKSEGPVVKPLDLQAEIGTDPFRYFLTREVVLGNDAQFSREAVVNRINSELANNLGNLSSRVIGLFQKYFQGLAPEASSRLPETEPLKKQALMVGEAVKSAVDQMAPQNAVGSVVELLSETNRYLDKIAPWKLAKTNLPDAGECLITALEVVRIAAVLLSPVMPSKMGDLLEILGQSRESEASSYVTWGLIRAGTKLEISAPLFPRIEL